MRISLIGRSKNVEIFKAAKNLKLLKIYWEKTLFCFQHQKLSFDEINLVKVISI